MRHATTTERWDDPLMAAIRPAIREAIEAAVAAELTAVLGAARYERWRPRLGYRHGTQERVIGTPMGAVTVTVPRARVSGCPTREEWHSTLLPRYQRRLRRLDETILGVYLSGTNQRKIAAALRPLLTGVALSKSAISRLVGQLQLAREEWRQRRLEDERCHEPRRARVRAHASALGAALPRRGREPGRGRPRVAHLLCVSLRPVESPAQHQPDRTHSRRAPASHQNAGHVEHRARPAQFAPRPLCGGHHPLPAH